MGDIDRELRRWRELPRERPDHLEAPGPGQESVWDYPRPPRVEAVSPEIRVEFAGVVLARTRRALRVLETAGPPVYYLPPDDVRVRHLERTGDSTLCEWKGEAVYWTVRSGERTSPRAAWSYPRPLAGFEAIRGYFAFHAGRVDACFVGRESASPQPGEYYGGWITSAVVGPFKGEPGSERW